MSLESVTNLVNAIAFVAFVGLLGLAVVRMLIRMLFFRRIGRTASILLRRDLALLGALLVVFGSVAFIRFFQWDVFLEHGWPRLLYIAASDILAIGCLAYWVWAEYFVIGKPPPKEIDLGD